MAIALPRSKETRSRMGKAVIFGASGQDGAYLSRLLARRGIAVTGVSRSGATRADVADFARVQTLIKDAQPDYIFHFAANSTARHEALFDNHAAIGTGALNILESVRLFSPHSRVFITGSALQFENSGLPIHEQTPFHASSPYAVARIQATYAARYYREAFGLHTYVGYLFTHDSPLRTERHVNQQIIADIRRIKSGRQSTLEIGDMAVRKEFSHAGDIVEAIWALVNQDTHAECVIGSGVAHSIEEWLRYCCRRSGLSFAEHVRPKKNFTAEYHTLVSAPDRLKSMGWSPKISFEQLADMMLEGRDPAL